MQNEEGTVEMLYHQLRRRKSVRIVGEVYDSVRQVYRLEILFDVRFEAIQFVFEYGRQVKVSYKLYLMIQEDFH